jgi:hypothetical protein
VRRPPPIPASVFTLGKLAFIFSTFLCFWFIQLLTEMRDCSTPARFLAAGHGFHRGATVPAGIPSSLSLSLILAIRFRSNGPDLKIPFRLII